jgi:hypothetical protein
MAVAVRILGGDRIKLSCPARMEPWSMDHLALDVWQEARRDLDQPYAIDIYETYIGGAPVKVGELRAVPDKPTVAHIAYKFPPNLCGLHVPVIATDTTMRR